MTILTTVLTQFGRNLRDNLITTLRNSLSLAQFGIYSVSFLIGVLSLGHLSVLSRSLVGGRMGGDVTAVRVVFMRGGRAQ